MTKTRDIDDTIDSLIDYIDFDDLKAWCLFLEVDYEEPPIDDMYPDWEMELRTELGEAFLKRFEAFKKGKVGN